MRVLICSEEAPLPPINGMRLVVGELVSRLHPHHQVDVLAYRKPDQGSAQAAGMHLLPHPPRTRAAQLRGAARFVAGRPWFVDEDADGLSSALEDAVRRHRPDVVHVFSPRLAPLARALRGVPKIISILDAWHRNVEAQALVADAARRLLFSAQLRRVRRFESRAYRPYDRIVVVTEEDRRAVHGLDPSLAVAVIPNGVELDRFHLPDVERVPARVLFHGSLGYAPNVAAAEAAADVVARVREQIPDAELVLVGRSPSARVRALGDRPGVRVVGEVPDVAPWLASASAYLCPMRSGTGIKNKLLEAMASSSPCVVTPLALQGVAAEPGEDVLVGSTVDELAAALVEVLSDGTVAGRLGARGRACVERSHSWQHAAEAYTRVYAEVLRGGTGQKHPK